MRLKWLLLFLLAAPLNAALAEVRISLDIKSYPKLVAVPGYPVYYAPQINANYFFYDGMYWLFEHDNWYSSLWYNGPWYDVDSNHIPDNVLRVPVRYYRQAPAYFRGWQSNAAPRWNVHWGTTWAEQRRGWDRRDRQARPHPAPLPSYQRRYSADRYPHAERQIDLHRENSRYQPRDAFVREQYRSRHESERNRGPNEHDGRSRQGTERPADRAVERPPAVAPPHIGAPRGDAGDHRSDGRRDRGPDEGRKP